MTRASQLTIAMMTVVALGGCQISGHTVPTKQNASGDTSDASRVQLDRSYGQLPLSFEANQGQTDPRVQFLARGRGYTLFLTQDEAVFVLRKAKAQTEDSSRVTDSAELVAGRHASREYERTVLRMKLEGVNPSPIAHGLSPLPGIVNYFIGNDPQNWRTNIPTYKKVEYKEVYPGIDLAYYGNQGKLEYDLIVAPGADTTQIKLALEGAKEITLADSGDLILTTDTGDIRLQKPFVYQLGENDRQELIAGNYVLRQSDTQAIGKRLSAVGIQLASYDKSRPVVIDPVLVYSTYLGGNGFEESFAIAVDASGNAYVTSFTDSTDFPTTAGAFQTTYAGGSDDVFVTKLNPTGSGLVYSTYLGGTGEDLGFGIAVDASGNAYVTGETDFSTDFPTTAGAFQPARAGGGDAFVTKLNPTGSGLVYSTHLGGTADEFGFGIAVDTLGNGYVTGRTRSTDFPTTVGAFQTIFGGGLFDGFVTKLNPTGSALVYSTYLGGSGSDNQSFAGIAVDTGGNAYVTADTDSANFPTTSGAFQTVYGGNFDAFVTKLNSIGSAPVYSTYLGGSGSDFTGSIALDAAGNAYVTGSTDSANFPTTVGAFQTIYSGGVSDVIVTKLNPTGSALVYSTYLGGGGDDEGTGIALDAAGNAYVGGFTDSTNFPTTAGVFQPTFGGGPFDAFVTKVNPAGSGLVYSTYLGGSDLDFSFRIALDAAENAYVTGGTSSTDFPTVNPVQATLGGSLDTFVAKIGDVPINTPVGSNIVVQPIDVSTTLTFSSVTGAGVSSLIRRNGGPAPPAGFSLGTPPTYYEITTTATFTGPVTVCITYNPAQFGDPTMLHLLHLEGAVWVDVTTTNDTINFVICGQVSSFSMFVITQSAVRRVTIDIKPGSFPNTINLGSQGTVPVAIFSTPSFDATTVDPLTVTLASAPVGLKGKGTPMASFQDVNGDNLLDLVVHVETEALQMSPTDTIAVLDGATFSSEVIRGTDSVRVVP